MAKARSPAYPSISLREAIERVTAVYNRDYQNPIPKEVVAQHMGYVGLNGKSLGVLSSLSKYGLLEGRGNESRVSDLAVRIIAHPPGSPERAEAVRQAAGEPALFSELDGRFQGGRASDQAIRSYLMTQKFIPGAADAAIRSYRETKQLLEAESAGREEGTAERDDSEPPAASHPRPDVEWRSPTRGTTAGPSERQAEEGRRPLPQGSGSGISRDDLPEGEPYSIQLRPNGIDVVARLRTSEDLDKLMSTLTALKGLVSPGNPTRSRSNDPPSTHDDNDKGA